ncbi:hypothetical protein HDE76_003569 [Rhodanobacter sp. ANJX3]|nr:hypothetical protein [Rhodanobacter sp. ANJX3]NYE28186.1 hypothetical protein [Rhodanobacter sp. K2T2]
MMKSGDEGRAMKGDGGYATSRDPRLSPEPAPSLLVSRPSLCSRPYSHPTGT